MWSHEIRARLASLRLAPERETEIVEEVAQHLDDRYRELRSSGRSEADAAAEAWRELEAADVLGREVAQVEKSRPIDLPAPGADSNRQMLSGLAADVRFAFRTLRKNPSFSIPVLLAMALSIGPTTAIVSVSNWLLWRPLPAVQRPNELGIVQFGRWFKEGGVAPMGVSYQNIADIEAGLTSVSGFAGVQEQSATLAIGDRLAELVQAGIVTGDFFQVLGIQIKTGRDFQPQDDMPPIGAPLAIVGEGLAQLAFGSPAAAIGQKITLNRKPFEVIGVAPEGFGGITRQGQVKVWITGSTMPYLLGIADTTRYTQRSGGSLAMFVVRRRDGRQWSEVETELTNLTAGLAAAHPQDNGKYLPGPNREAILPRVFAGLGERPLSRTRTQETVRLLLAVGGVLVLLGCANVANLMVFRASKREREVAVRKALGASAARLIQLQLTESWLLAVAGAALGLLLAVILKSILQDLLFPMPAGTSANVPFDMRVLGVTLAVATATGVLAGLAPAWIAARSRLSTALARGSSRSVFRTPKLRSGLAVLQLALSLTLLIGAVLLVTTVRNLHAVDLGFTPDRITTLDISLSSQGYTPNAALALWKTIQTTAEAGHQFEDVATGSGAPFGSKFIISLVPPDAVPGQELNVAGAGASATYFRTLGMTMLRGRGFTEEEAFALTSPNPTPVVVSEMLARRLFGSIDVVGRTVKFKKTLGNPERDLPIIGVVRDARESLTGEGDPFIYMPYWRFDFGTNRGTIIVRSSRSAADITASIRAIVAQVDKSLPVAAGVPLTVQIDRRIAQQRLFAWTLSVLGGLGFVLAALGVYGLVAQATAERSREFGIRIAIGASASQIVRLVFRFAATIAVMGTVGGIVLAYFGSRTVSSMLFGITALDARAYLAAIGALALVVAAACAIPAVRAMRVEPVEVLRAD
jgi:predicted permease